MRRTTPSDRGSNAPSRANSRKAGSETSDDHDNANGAKTSREEREAAYQEARARIFKDFVESPPETPPPSKTEKSKRKEQPDDFSGRSQFYPVLAPPIQQATHYYPQPVYPDPSMHMAPQGPPRFNPASATFNPGAQAFNPTSAPYTPQRQFQYGQPQLDNRSFPPPVYPGQQSMPVQRTFYPPPPPQQRPQPMQPSYSSNGYPHTSPPRANPYISQPPLPPPQQQQQQQQQQQRMQQPLGWPPAGGHPLNVRSTSAPGHYDMQNGYAQPPQQPPPAPWVSQQAQQPPAWGPGRGMRM